MFIQMVAIGYILYVFLQIYFIEKNLYFSH